MRRLYLLVYGDELGTREQVKAAVDADPQVITWRYDLPNSFYLVSEANAKALATSVRNALPTGRFVISLADEDYWGWNMDETWHLFQNKSHKPDSGA